MDLSPAEELLSKKNIITFLILAILILAIPLSVSLLKQQVLKARATGQEIKFSGTGVTCDPNAAPNEVGCTTTSQTIRIELTSPFGP